MLWYQVCAPAALSQLLRSSRRRRSPRLEASVKVWKPGWLPVFQMTGCQTCLQSHDLHFPITQSYQWRPVSAGGCIRFGFFEVFNHSRIIISFICCWYRRQRRPETYELSQFGIVTRRKVQLCQMCLAVNVATESEFLFRLKIFLKISFLVSFDTKQICLHHEIIINVMHSILKPKELRPFNADVVKCTVHNI